MSTYLQYVYKTNNLDNLIKLESSKLYLNLKSAITKQIKKIILDLKNRFSLHQAYFLLKINIDISNYVDIWLRYEVFIYHLNVKRLECLSAFTTKMK